MTDTTANPEDKGLPPGVTSGDTGGEKRGAGAPSAPTISNAPPAKEEEKPAEGDTPPPDKTGDTPEDTTDPKKEESKKEENSPPVDYEDYGDDTANSVAAVLKEAGVTAQEADEIFRDAIDGDFSKVKLSELVQKVGKDKANMIMLGVQDYYNRVNQSTKEIVSAVYNEIGGEENWIKVRTWAQEKSQKDSSFKSKVDGFNQMIDLNPVAAAMAAKELRSLYEQDQGNSSLVRKVVKGDSAVSTAQSSFEALSRKDYVAQVKAAYAKGDTNEIARLRAQRKATRDTI